MFRECATRLLSVNRILVLTLSLSAAAGWVSFAVSNQSSTKLEDQLRRELASLQDTQAKLLSERAKTRASLSEMATGQRLDFQVHQALGRKGEHVADQIGIGPLFDQLDQGHSLVGHRRLRVEGQVSLPEL
jgi:hypothetical protein